MFSRLLLVCRRGLLAGLIALLPCAAWADISFSDPALEEAIRYNLAIPEAPLTQDDLDTLTFLDGENFGITSIAGIEQCPNLEEVYLGLNEFSDASPLAQLPALVRADLSSNENLNPSTLAGVTQLQYLSVAFCGVSSLGFLTNLTGLLELGITGNELTSLSGVQGCTQLLWLDASGNPITDISAVASLASLNYLYLNETQVSSLAAVTGLGQLLRLEAQNAALSGALVLPSLAGLTDMKLAHNAITSIDGLGNVPSLETLDLSYNQLTQLPTPFAAPSLQRLDLTVNQISNIGPLAGLTSLEYLALTANPVGDIAVLAGLTGLDELYLNLTQVSDLQPLLLNPGIAGGDFINVGGAPLSDLSCGLVIRVLRESAVFFSYGNACDPVAAADLYVDDDAGETLPQRGTQFAPYGRISYALSYASGYASPAQPVNIHVAEGTYAETLVLPPHVRVVGAGQSKSIIAPPASKIAQAPGVVVQAGEDTGLESAGVALPFDAQIGTKLVSIIDVAATLRDMDLFGAQVPSSIGVFVRGESSSASLVKDCRIRSVGIGLDIAFSAARFAFNDFENINGEAAIKISQSTGSTPLVGDLSDLVNTGSNSFNAVTSVFIKSDNPADTAAAANFWENVYDPLQIDALMDGAVDAGKPLFTLDVKDIFAATAFVTLLDGATLAPIVGASIALVPTKAALPESPTPGIYTATIAPGRYTFRIRKTGYEEQVFLADVHSGINGITFYLGQAPVEGESPTPIHSGDTDRSGNFSLSEMLRGVQLFNAAAFSCGFEEDGFQLGLAGGSDCPPHAGDYLGGGPNWRISLSELLRMVQLFSLGAYHPCEAGEDGFCPGPL